MKRVVVTGIGIVSCLGNDQASVLASLKNGKSGITFNEEYKEMGLRSHVSGSINIDLDELIDRRPRRFMSDAAGFAYVAMQQSIEDAGLTKELVSNVRTGLVAGSGGGSMESMVEAADILRKKGVKS